MAIGVQIQAQRIIIAASKRVSRDKPSIGRIVVSRTQIDGSGFLIIILATIPKCIGVSVINILFYTKSIILICFSNSTIVVC